MRNINQQLAQLYPTQYHKLASPAFYGAAQPGAPAGIGGWKELARTTLGATSDDIIVSSLADKRYYMFLISAINSGNLRTDLQLGSGSTDTGNNYAFRYSETGATDITGTSQSSILMSNGGVSTVNNFMAGYIANLSAKEKLILGHTVNQNTAGAGTPPGRREFVGKWVNTLNPLDVITAHNNNAGDFAIGSEVVVLEWDPADIHTDNFWEQLASVDLSGGASDNLSTGTFSAKKYLWVQIYLKESGVCNLSLSFNNVTTGNKYALRTSTDGGADVTSTSQNSLGLGQIVGTTAGRFINMFIVNDGSREKLGIYNHMDSNSSGAGNAPGRVEATLKDVGVTQITEIDCDNSQSGSYDTVSAIKVWGSN